MPKYRKENLSNEAFDMIGERFKALAEPMRLRLVYALMDDEKTVSQLVEETGGFQANISKHLKMLLELGIVTRRKQGLNSYYSITDRTVFELCDLMCDSIQERLEAGLGGFSRP